MIRTLILATVLAAVACHKDAPPPPKPPAADDPVAAPVSPVTKEPIASPSR